MNTLLILIPLALVLGLLWLGFFMWSLKTNQYDDLDGAAQRILIDDDAVEPRAPQAPPPVAGTPTQSDR